MQRVSSGNLSRSASRSLPALTTTIDYEFLLKVNPASTVVPEAISFATFNSRAMIDSTVVEMILNTRLKSHFRRQPSARLVK
jgi:hypothetical protein